MATITTALAARAKSPSSLLSSVAILTAIGVVAVYTTSYAQSAREGQDIYLYLKLQLRWAAIGALALLVMWRIGYERLRPLAMPALLLTIGLLGAVWVPGLGKEVKGATRWLALGPIQVQPSEVAKVVLTIYLAAVLTKSTHDVRNLKEGLGPLLAAIGVVCFLVLCGKDLGTTTVIGVSGLTVLAVAGARRKHLSVVGIVVVALFGMLIVMQPYRLARIKAWWNAEAHKAGKAYQPQKGVDSVGSGGLTGAGPGGGHGKRSIPEPNTDYVFATVAEEGGLLASVAVVGLMGFVSWFAFSVARSVSDPFGMLLATGIGATLSWQTILNISVVTGLVPATGVPLPFISYGGTALVIAMGAVGILLSIAQRAAARTRG